MIGGTVTRHWKKKNWSLMAFYSIVPDYKWKTFQVYVLPENVDEIDGNESILLDFEFTILRQDGSMLHRSKSKFSDL